MIKIAVSQPTFLPWPGYFGLIDFCDYFIFLDSVQFERRSWHQSNFIKTSKGKHKLTLPIKSKGLYTQKIFETEIFLDNKVFLNIPKTVQTYYSTTKYYLKYKKEFDSFFFNNQKNLSEFNIELIKFFCQLMKIKTKFFKSSKISTSGKKGELIYNIINSFKFDDVEYYYTPGSEDYILKSSLFSKKRISLKKFIFTYPKHKQRFVDFVSDLSIIDIIFNEGPETSLEKIRNSVQIESIS